MYKPGEKERVYRISVLKYIDAVSKPIGVSKMKREAVGCDSGLAFACAWLLEHRYLKQVGEPHGRGAYNVALTSKGHATIMKGEFDFVDVERGPYAFFFNNVCPGTLCAAAVKCNVPQCCQ